MLLFGCPVLDDVLLTVDELVVNALRHTRSGRPGGTFAVDIVSWGGSFAVAVTDEGAPCEPAVADADADAGDDAESGRGLRTVSLLASGWGWFGNDRSRAVAALFTPTAVSLGEIA
ncbi:ATP-binding protein [Actinomadura nitritigenes]|uniref:ATP-binding protein n=1 Tax=Actinomadura nitritigenes TaxID=134602 RepID=UPI003D907E55